MNRLVKEIQRAVASKNESIKRQSGGSKSFRDDYNVYDDYEYNQSDPPHSDYWDSNYWDDEYPEFDYADKDEN